MSGVPAPPYELTTREITRRTLITAGAVSQRVARADRAGLVERSPLAGVLPNGFTDTVFIDKVMIVSGEVRERPRVTLAEVAARCDVSRMTVSNAYNHPDQLSAELRQRVLAMAEELGYGGPSAAGRALKRGRSDVLGVLLTEALPYAFGDPGTVSFLHGVTAATAAAGLALQLIPAAAETAERLVRDAAVDGLIAHSPADDDPAGWHQRR